MKLKSLAAVVAATLSLAAFDASACSFAAWIQDGGGAGTVASGGVGTTLVAGEPDDVIAVSRYAGRCGNAGTAIGNFVRDGSPTSEATYRARFYVKATNDGQVVFRARNAANADMIVVTHNAAGFQFTTTGGSASSAPVTANRWYSVELNWAAGAAMTAIVQGNASATPLATVTTPAAGAADRIDLAELGWISGGTGGPVSTDAFESRRTTAIGRLCRGDANADTNINVGDRVIITNEILGSTLGTGQPDVTEDGTVNAGDRVALSNLILASATCN